MKRCFLRHYLINMIKNSIKIVAVFVCIVSFMNVHAEEKKFVISEYPKSFSKGWNLVPIEFVDPLLATGKLKYAYVLDLRTQTYVGGDIQDAAALDSVVDWLQEAGYTRNSFFVYLDESVTNIVGKAINHGLQESQSTLKLHKGWNAIVYPKEFAGKNINDFIGSCQVEKAFAFNTESNSWYDLRDFLYQSSFDLGHDDVGLGFVIKVKEECSFNFAKDKAVPALPKLP